MPRKRKSDAGVETEDVRSIKAVYEESTDDEGRKAVTRVEKSVDGGTEEVFAEGEPRTVDET